MKIIYQNAFYVPSVDKFFCSWSTHDFVGYTFPDGKQIFYDGGLSYIRRVGNLELLLNGLVVDLTLTSDSPLESIYNDLLILLTKDKYVRISSLEKPHLNTIIQWFNEPNNYLPIVKETAEYWYDKRKI
jgi:hypothetical protein